MSNRIFKYIFLIGACVLMTSNIVEAQINKVTLHDMGNPYKMGNVNLQQRYRPDPTNSLAERYFTNLYSFYLKDGKLSFGENFDDHTAIIEDLGFSMLDVSMDNSTMLGLKKDTLFIYDIGQNKITNSFTVIRARHTSLSIDGSQVFLSRKIDDKTFVQIIDANTSKVLWSIESKEPDGTSISSNERYLALKYSDEIKVYDLWEGGDPMVHKSRSVEKRKESSKEKFKHMKISPNGRLVISYVLSGKFKKKILNIHHLTVVDILTGERLMTQKFEENTDHYFFSLDPSGKVLFARGKFFEVDTGRELQVINNYESYTDINDFQFHPFYPGLYHGDYSGFCVFE